MDEENRGGEPDRTTDAEGNRTAFIPQADIAFTAEGVRIVLDKVRLTDLFDQSPDMLAAPGQGCISSPGGPRC